MCQACVEEYMADEGRSEPPSSAEHTVLVLAIACYYQLPGCGAGGPLHIVLDDLNVEDEHIRWCVDNMEVSGESPGHLAATTKAVADALLAIPSLAVRAAVCHHGSGLGYWIAYGRLPASPGRPA